MAQIEKRVCLAIVLHLSSLLPIVLLGSSFEVSPRSRLGQFEHNKAVSSPVDTSTWIGAEYTPSNASNSLWWWRWDVYGEQVDAELGYAAKQLGIRAVRMFLHTTVYEADVGKTLLANVEK